MSTLAAATRAVTIPAGLDHCVGELALPDRPAGVVLFAHGSGSSRNSPRNRFVAQLLHDAGFATLLFDLLTEDEARDRHNVFDVDLLSERLLSAAHWVLTSEATEALPVGIFGASTGAAAALVAAAREPEVRAVVSRGGRPDLADCWLEGVRAPTLLIVSDRDRTVLDVNRRALRELRCAKRLVIVPNATHLFEEPGALEHAARLAEAWFRKHLAGEPR